MNISPARGLVLDLYQPLRHLGEGGMGQVKLARNVRTGQDVVLKFLRPDHAQDSRSRARFLNEIRLMQQFRHPGAVALLDAVVDGPEPCLVLELVSGPTLEDLLRRQGRFTPRRIGAWLGQLCLVLHAAHGRGLLHRDLSLANVMVQHAQTERETIKLMDFGLGRQGGGFFLSLEQLTGGGNSIGGGTPDYLCPEQIRGEAVDQRGDLYSLGVMLYQLLSGRLPFQDAQGVSAILQAHLHQIPPTFRALGISDIPLPLEAVVRRLLAKDPNQRPAHARAVAEEFGNALGRPIAAPEDFEPHQALTETMEQPILADENVLARLQAWMPEAIALMKLRGFIAGVQGQVLDSQPGVIRMQVADPRQEEELPARGFLSLFGLGRRRLREPQLLTLELHLEKKQEQGRGLVEILVVLDAAPTPDAAESAMRRGFGERLCRELQAYLMCGRA